MDYLTDHEYTDDTITYTNDENPFNTDTTERIIYALLIKLINQCIQRNKELDRRLLLDDNLELPKLPANQAFTKRLISKFDFNFSVSMLEVKLFKLLPSPKGRETHERFDSFFSKCIPLLEAFHYHYLKYILKQRTKERNNNRETIKRFLLAAASDNKADPMNAKQLANYINNQLLTIPRELNNEEIFIEYKKQLPKKVIKTKITVKRDYKVADTRTEPIIKSNPWTSPRKVSEHFERNNWNDNEIDTWRQQQRTDYFNQKEQTKKYMLKTVAPRHSFIIDYFFPGKFIYLLAININTRKAYAIPSETIKEVNSGRYTINETGNKTATQAVKLLNKLIKEAKNVKHILCDQESAFISDTFKNECEKRNIELKHYIKNHMDGVIETKESSRGIHNALSLIDRLSRTIRKMNYNIGNNANIDPPTMEYLLNEYNNSPHATLSKIIGSPITPNIVNEIPQLEDFIVEQLMKENLKIKLRDDYNIVGEWCRCVNESSKFDKIKNKLLPGIWKVVGTEDGLFICRQYNGNVPTDNYVKLPRVMIRVIDFFS